MLCKNELEREMRIIVQTMITSNCIIKKLPFNEFGLFFSNQKKSRFSKKIDTEVFNAMFKHHYITAKEDCFKLTNIAKNWVNSFLVFVELKKDPTVMQEYNQSKQVKKPRRDFTEADALIGELGATTSPIFKLYNRQKSSPNSYLTVSHLKAGQTIFDIFTNTKLTPNVTTNVERLMAGPQKHYMGTKTENVSDKSYNARKKLYNILEYLGDEFAAIIVEVCIFGSGLVVVEKMFDWPARSAKLLLTMALNRLAEYLEIKKEIPAANKYINWAKTV